MIESNTTDDAVQAPSVAQFNDASELLLYILDGATAVALNVREADFRAVYPSPVQADELPVVVEQHLSGNLNPRSCLRKDGSTFESTKHYSLGAYTVRRGDNDTFTTRSLTLDVDGPDHDGTKSQAEVDALARNLYDILDNEGMQPLLTHSHGGRGYHVWVLFDVPIEAGFAKMLGEAAVFQSETNIGVEVFPKKTELELGSLGNAIALPLNGRKISEKGGAIIWPDGTLRPVETIQCASAANLSVHLTAYARIAAAGARIKAAKTARAEFDTLLKAGVRDSNDFSDLGLETICKSLGEVTDEFVGEIDIIKLNCPRHVSRSRTSLHVCPADRWWKCQGCGGKGAGDSAAMTLTEWLMPGASNEDVLKKLEQLRLDPGAGVSNAV